MAPGNWRVRCSPRCDPQAEAGVTSQQLALQLGIKDKDQRYLIFDAIDILLDDGRIESGKKAGTWRSVVGTQCEGKHRHHQQWGGLCADTVKLAMCT